MIATARPGVDVTTHHSDFVKVDNITGISQAEAMERLKLEGANDLPSSKPRTIWQIAWAWCVPVLLSLRAMLSRLRATARPEVFLISRAEMLIKRRVKFAMASNSWSSTSDGERLHPDSR